MDRKKSKKIRNLRIIITNTFMTITVLAIVFVLILVAQGYSINRNGDIQQSGLIQIQSRPSGATVKIDGETQFSRTEINKMLSSGNHDFIISKAGYDTWHSSATVFSGLLTRIEWVRLFPLQLESTNTKNFNELQLATVSPDRTQLLTLEKGATSLEILSLQNEKPKINSIDLLELFKLDAEAIQNARLSIENWNSNSNRLLAKLQLADASPIWYMINLDSTDKSINLNDLTALDITKALIANDSASKFWILDSEQKLYSIDSSTMMPTPQLVAESVEKIANNKDTIAYTKQSPRETDPNTLERLLYIYKDGETDSSFIKNLGLASANANFILGTYWDSEWIAYNADKNIEVLSGKYPSVDKKNKSLEPIYSETISFSPSLLTANPRSRIISFANNNQYQSYDIENRQSFSFQAYQNITAINWLDDFIIWHRNDSKIVVRDFDGQNRREIINGIDNDLPVIISANNKWLYYFEISEKEATPTTDNAEATENESSETTKDSPQVQIVYTLKRMSL